MVNMHKKAKSCPRKPCGNNVRLKHGLNKHPTVHMRGNRKQCQKCDKQFRNRHALNQHSSVMHARVRTHHCFKCHKKVGRPCPILRKHQLSYAAGMQPIACDNCGKKFTQKSTPEGHRRVHTGERPYLCNICAFNFNTGPTAKVHKLHVHQASQSWLDQAKALSTAQAQSTKVRKTGWNNSPK